MSETHYACAEEGAEFNRKKKQPTQTKKPAPKQQRSHNLKGSLILLELLQLN